MPCKNLDKALLFSRNHVFCLKICKLWPAPTTLQFDIFCSNFAHVTYLPISAKECVWVFFILFRSWIIYKSLKRSGFYTLVFYTFINNSRSKQNQTNPTHAFVDITKQKTCAKFQQKILNMEVGGASQSFQFFRQKTCFLGNNKGLP